MINAQPYPPFIRTLRRLRGAFWRRRFLHWLVRAMWITLLVPIGVIVGYIWFGWQVSWDIGLALMGLVAFGSLLWSLRPISMQKMSRRLDRLLEKQSQIVAAYEVSHKAGNPGYADNPVAEQLVQDAVITAVEIRRQVSLLGRGFWIELHTLVAMIAILGGMLIFDVFTANVPNTALMDLPPPFQEPKADEVIPPNPALMPPPAQEQVETLSQAQVQAALEALADAFRDQAASRSVSDALDQGDIGQAAENLRQLADQLDQLSGGAQQELGDALQEASDNVGDNFPSLSETAQRGSDALENGNVPGASRSVEEIANLLEALEEGLQNPSEQPGESGSEQSESGQGSDPGEGEEAEEGGGDASGEGEGDDQLLDEEEERLPIDGEPLELESDPEFEEQVLQPSKLNAQAGDERTDDSPFARQPLNAPGDDLGPDSLSYPWEKRDIIRQYFTP